LNKRANNDFSLIGFFAARVGGGIPPTRGHDGSTLSGPFRVYTTSKLVRSSCDGVGSTTAVARGMIGLGTLAGGILFSA
jgi:hypothetical protein